MGTGDAEKSAEKSAEKNNWQNSEDGPMGEEFGFFKGEKFLRAKFFKGEPMGRRERFGLGGVWVEDAGKVEGGR